jgi:PRTRC genetic system protein A/PRTRC genetic system ThiF family protein
MPIDIRDLVIQQHAPTVMAPSVGELVPLAENGHRYVAARDGLYIEIRRPWLRLLQPIAPSIATQLPYGELKPAIATDFGKIPRDMLARFLEEARKLSPFEHAAWIVWSARDRRLEYRDLDVQEMSYGSVSYNRPRLEEHESLAIDLHSHGEMGAFFSGTDDADDAGEVKIAGVVGALKEGTAPEWAFRCASSAAAATARRCSPASRARPSRCARSITRPRRHRHDPDTVSPANVGRQLFSPGDVGRNKATVLVHRLNAFFGIARLASRAAARSRSPTSRATSSSAASTRARARVDQLRAVAGLRRPAARITPGVLDRSRQPQSRRPGRARVPARAKRLARGRTGLPTVAELFPEIIKGGREDNTPSCSLAEALEKQHLFVNQAVVTPALQILWQLLRFGQIDWHGAFVNLNGG